MNCLDFCGWLFCLNWFSLLFCLFAFPPWALGMRQDTFSEVFSKHLISVEGFVGEGYYYRFIWVYGIILALFFYAITALLSFGEGNYLLSCSGTQGGWGSSRHRAFKFKIVNSEDVNWFILLPQRAIKGCLCSRGGRNLLKGGDASSIILVLWTLKNYSLYILYIINNKHFNFDYLRIINLNPKLIEKGIENLSQNQKSQKSQNICIFILIFCVLVIDFP